MKQTIKTVPLSEVLKNKSETGPRKNVSRDNDITTVKVSQIPTSKATKVAKTKVDKTVAKSVVKAAVKPVAKSAVKSKVAELAAKNHIPIEDEEAFVVLEVSKAGNPHYRYTSKMEEDRAYKSKGFVAWKNKFGVPVVEEMV